MANRKAGPVWAPSPLGLSTWTCRLRVFSPGPFLSACVARLAGSWQRPVARPLDPAHKFWTDLQPKVESERLESLGPHVCIRVLLRSQSHAAVLCGLPRQAAGGDPHRTAG